MTQADDARERAMVTLRETILAGHLEKHEMEQRAVRTALDAAETRQEEHRLSHADSHRAHENIHEVTLVAHRENHEAENEAVKAAVTAMDRRLNQMNEFREQLREQAATFVRTDAFETFKEERRHALATLDASIDSRVEALTKLIQTEREERRANEGVKRGMGQTTTIIVAAVGLVGTALGIVIILANVLTGTP